MSTQTPNLRTAAQAVIDRWETPLWKDAPATAGYIAALRDALAADHIGEATDMVGRWYMVNRDGMATLCVDREDAEKEAANANLNWPKRLGPHRAVQLVEAQATALAKPYCYEDCMAYTAGIEKELQDAQAAARPTPTHLEAMERAWLWMENQADSQSKGGHETFDLMMLREERDALRAAIDAAPTTQPAPQQEAQEPVAWQYRSMPDMGGVWFECTKERADQRAAHPEKWEVRALYTAPQPSPAAQEGK